MKLKFLKKVLFVCASFFSLSGCQKKESNAFSPIDRNGKILLKKQEGIDSFVYIQTDSQLNSIARYDDAMILVSRPGCQYCDSLIYSLRGNKDAKGIFSNGYIYKTSAIVYLVDFQTYYTCYQSKDNKLGSYAKLYPEIKGTPVLLFYSEGRLVNTRTGHFYDVTPDKIDRKDEEGNLKKTGSILSEYVIDQNYYSLNTLKRVVNSSSTYSVYYEEDRDETEDTLGFGTELLDEKLNSDFDEMTIIFSWRRCSDCSIFRSYVTEPFLKNTGKKLYFYETDGYSLKKRSTDDNEKDKGEKLWQEFCGKYHLDDIPGYSNTYGKTGAVPAIIRYRKDKTHTTRTFRNDTDLKLDSEGKLYYSTSMYDQVKELRSDTTLDSIDTAEKIYIKALKELSKKRDDLEMSIVYSFLAEGL